jgi:hypothetical protein
MIIETLINIFQNEFIYITKLIEKYYDKKLSNNNSKQKKSYIINKNNLIIPGIWQKYMIIQNR